MKRHRSTYSVQVFGAIAAVLVLATAGPVAATHYPDVRASVKRKDRAVLDAIRRLTYADSTYITLEPNTCDCLEPTCDEGHFMVGCGGEMVPYNAGLLSSARRTSRETCLVCGCVWDQPADLRATPVCAGF